jgi:hypothetical protein
LFPIGIKPILEGLQHIPSITNVVLKIKIYGAIHPRAKAAGLSGRKSVIGLIGKTE